MEYSEDDKIVLWLSMNLGTGSAKFFDLINYYGDIDGIWHNYDMRDRGINFLSPKIKASLDKTRDMGYVNNCIKKWKEPKFVTIFNNNYPILLKETADPPVILYYLGNLRIYDRCISIVGSRKCTKYGLDCAKKFAYDLAAEGITIVSGGARGIDTKAHEGALSARGTTFCVLGCGIDIVYPPENHELFYKIAESGGAIITEYLPGERPAPWHFPERNRIISGMSKGVLVVEAGEKSGSLITAAQAAEEGRDVFCVPGNIDSATSKGTNNLIKNGAILTDSCQDIMFEYGWNKGQQKTNLFIDNFENLNDTERTIVNAIVKSGSISIDELCITTGMDITELNSTVTILEINGVINRMPGNILTI